MTLSLFPRVQLLLWFTSLCDSKASFIQTFTPWAWASTSRILPGRVFSDLVKRTNAFSFSLGPDHVIHSFFCTAYQSRTKRAPCESQIWAVRCSLLFLSSHCLWSYFMCIHVCVLTEIHLSILCTCEMLALIHRRNLLSAKALIVFLLMLLVPKLGFCLVRTCALITNISKWKMFAFHIYMNIHIYVHTHICISQTLYWKGPWNILFTCIIFSPSPLIFSLQQQGWTKLYKHMCSP